MSEELLHPEISFIGNRQQIISFISCLDNIDYSSLDWSNPNRIELAKYKTLTKLERENIPLKSKKSSNSNNFKNITKTNNDETNKNNFEKIFNVTLHLFVSGKNCYSYTKRNACNGCIDFDRNDGIIYFIDSIADKKNFKKFVKMIENDFQKSEANIKDKKTIFIIGNRFDDKLDKKNSISSKEIIQQLNF